MRSSLPPPTKAERRRFDALKVMGCIACRKAGRGYVPPEIHHLVQGGKRMGHKFTIPLCTWHHQGSVPFQSVNRDHAAMVYGPSLVQKRRFVSCWGSELDLLREVNEALGDG